MKIINRELVFDGKFIKVIAKHFENKAGERGVWETVMKKLKKQQAVRIFPLTKEKEVIVEKIFRIPHECYLLELPAGVSDKDGESLEETAKRELLEETGYISDNIIEIFRATSDASLSAMNVFYFFAKDVEYVGCNKLEPAEEIEIIKVPIDKMVEMALNPPAGVKISHDFLALLPILQYKKIID